MIDIHSVDATLTFDTGARTALADVVMQFTAVDGGPAAFDLRQEIAEATLDGRPLPVEALAHRDLGGGEGAQMRVIDRPLPPGTAHELRLRYELATPNAHDAQPVGWDGGALFDLWMSDLYPGRYLEMWLPANLCGDRFALTLDIQITGDRRYQRLHNGDEAGTVIRYPSHFTSLSPMLVIVPTDEWTVARRKAPQLLTVYALSGTDVDVEEQAGLVQQWLEDNARTYGPYVHGDRFTAYVWDSTRGMEYDGATTASVGALEHEVFHSWFGRGVKPASQNDGWIDEAYTTWSTASGRYEGERFAVEPLDLDEEPVLLSPAHPWGRVTPTDSYRKGAVLFAGIAHLAGGAEALKGAMAGFYLAHAGELVTTAVLEDHLAQTVSEDVRPLFRRYVYGQA